MATKPAVKISDAVKRARRTFDNEQKREIVLEALAAGPGRAVGVAKTHNIAPNLLYRWIDAYKKSGGELPAETETPIVKPYLGELQVLRAENKKLRDKLLQLILED